MVAVLYKWLMVSALSLPFLTPAAAVREPVAASPVYHPFYVSVTEVSHNVTEKSLEITCKVFAEDLEEVIRKNYKSAIDLEASKNKEGAMRLVGDYLQKHFSVLVNGKGVTLQFLGYEKEKESVYLYLQAEGVSSVKKLDITNTVLYDFSESQINIMHITANGKRQSQKISYPVKQVGFVW
jgi:hypothetical protein